LPIKEVSMLGIVIGGVHTVLVKKDKEWQKFLVPNSIHGVKKVIELLNGQKEVVFIGNRRWGTTFALALSSFGIEPLYYPLSIKGRGRVGALSKVFVSLVERQVKPKRFFEKYEKKEEFNPSFNPSEIDSYRLALEYIQATNEVREAKHHLLDHLRVLFPEIVPIKTISQEKRGATILLPVKSVPDIFTKKMERVLWNPAPEFLATEDDLPEEIRELARGSLGRYLPYDLKEKTLVSYKEALRNYFEQVNVKGRKLQELRDRVKNHRLVKIFNQSESICVLVGLLGWRTWPNWRELRRFAGLDVSRIDSKGRPRISRLRPEIRQYLFLLLKTNLGKRLTKDVKGRVKKIERMLKYLWKEELKNPVTTV
jgi:hypothetical protein